uniref:Uncharacterized protein n=1 Tax=Sparus aurata TaxID=8175 RepID=A0A671WCA7_SPAAU
MDKEKTFWRKTLWSHETKTELFGHHEQQYVWRREGEAFNPEDTRPTVQHGAARILLWGCFAASGSAALKKVNGIMKKKDYRQIIQENLKSSADDLVHQMHRIEVLEWPSLSPEKFRQRTIRSLWTAIKSS